MFIKLLTVAVALFLALYIVRAIVTRFEREKARVASEAKKRAAASRIPTLEQDPKTGVYRPRD